MACTVRSREVCYSVVGPSSSRHADLHLRDLRFPYLAVTSSLPGPCPCFLSRIVGLQRSQSPVACLFSYFFLLFTIWLHISHCLTGRQKTQPMATKASLSFSSGQCRKESQEIRLCVKYCKRKKYLLQKLRKIRDAW